MLRILNLLMKKCENTGFGEIFTRLHSKILKNSKPDRLVSVSLVEFVSNFALSAQYSDSQNVLLLSNGKNPSLVSKWIRPDLENIVSDYVGENKPVKPATLEFDFNKVMENGVPAWQDVVQDYETIQNHWNMTPELNEDSSEVEVLKKCEDFAIILEKTYGNSGSRPSENETNTMGKHSKGYKSQGPRNPINEALLHQRQSLPIYSARNEIIRKIRDNRTVIVVGETGSGKTTQIPQYLMEAGFVRGFGSGIAVTQPRRVAATSISQRVAEEVGTRLGDKVGYSIRFENCSSKYTKIKYLTDGMLLREVLSDPLLLNYNVVILDEAHERTLRTDILFGLLKSIQKQREEMEDENNKRKENRLSQNNDKKTDGKTLDLENKQPPRITELKIVIMSATLDSEKFSNYFDNAPVLYISGRQYPVKTLYTKEPQSDYLDSAHISVLQIHLETNPTSGDILVFLSGQEDIESLEKLLNESNKNLPKHNKILTTPIYAALPQREQNRVFDKTPPNMRKVVLATNIAETSITIPGIRYVVDSGVHKSRDYDSRIGVESLLVQPISKSSARQRMGRAGRIGNGVCYRLYTEYDFQKLDENEAPEINRRQLTSVILTLKASGIEDILNFDYIDAPSIPSLKNGLIELYSLEALDDSGKLTKLGEWMAEFPLDPVFSKVLYESVKYKCTREILDLVSAQSVETLFYSPADNRQTASEAHKKFQSIDGDHWTAINLLKMFDSYRENGTKIIVFDQDSEYPTENPEYNEKRSEETKAEGSGQRLSSRKEKEVMSAGKLEYWCRQNFVNYKNINYVFRVRKQIETMLTRMGIDVTVSCGDDTDSVLMCLLSGFFYKCAMLQPDGTYRSLVGTQTVHIHPSSTMFRKRVAAIVYNQLVFTNKLYAKGVSSIQPSWIQTAAPKLYGNINFSS
ncbi:hypothetical protein BB560_001672 [Smittium megazygosporum]|uniref:RNA helicase n=1 Tax=Smittium megazygosporum TaxID=133381 RepID=A0A2T9ZGV1_9FUNG|nr:hypothetical protein BB560_001672 [Smittium megazygosporum]